MRILLVGATGTIGRAIAKKLVAAFGDRVFEVIERRPLTRAFERELRVQVVRALPHRLGVFDDGEVEVFEGFGFLAGAEGGGTGAGGDRNQRGGRRIR